MREKKLDQLASNTNYATGVAVGTATKIAPPTVNVTDGKVPGDGFGAQWQNYVEHYLHKQIERSARLPFQNFKEVQDLPAVTSTPRFAYDPYCGFVLVANGVNNTVYAYPEFGIENDVYAGGAGPIPISLSPSNGPFAPKCVVALSSATAPQFFVGGTNAAATTKTVWIIDAAGGSSEQTMPVAGSVELLCQDAVTGHIYAFAADTNRSVLKRDSGTGVWTAIGQRGAGADAPTSADYCAANGGILILAQDSTSTHLVEKFTTSPYARTIHSINVGDATTVLGCRWSPQLEAFMSLTQSGWYVFADPAGSIQTWPCNDAGAIYTMNGGCLTETGCFTWTNGNACKAFARTWPGETPIALKFSDFSNAETGFLARYDGGALWFMTDRSGTKRLYRSSRAL
jgi:hypothetical protein